MKQIQILKITDIPRISVFLILAILLIAAPITTKSNTNILVIQALTLTLLAYVLLSKRLSEYITRPVIWFIFLSILFLSLYLIPVPVDVWLQLPGHALYQNSISLLERTGQPLNSHSVSVIPYATAKALLAILPALGMFLACITLEKKQLGWLVWILIAVASWQAAWGLTQAATGQPAHGAYRSYDHFVALMEVALPVVMGLIAYYFSANKHYAEQQRIILGLLVIIGLLILFSGLLSRSRGGIFSLTAALALIMLILYQHMKVYSIGLLSLMTILLISFNSVTSLTPMLNRFLTSNVDEDSRWEIFVDVVNGGKTFFPLGSGPGTFSEVFPAFQSFEALGANFVKFAHNDYLQLLFETGIVGVGIILGFILLYLHGWFTWFKSSTTYKRDNKQLYFMKAGAGAGILASLLHAFVDFNFHTIPHPMYFALLAGIFFRKVEASTHQSVRSVTINETYP